jgi:filamentous hemagglutinin family protein
MRKAVLISLLVAGCLACIAPARAQTVPSFDGASSDGVFPWETFDIAASESWSFDQSASDSIILGNIVGSSPTIISGSLATNGSLFLVNSNGFVLDAGSSVSVHRLYLATDYSAMERYIAGGSLYGGSLQGGDISLAGDIVASDVAILAGGIVNLLAGGSINSTGGTISLASGSGGISISNGAIISIAGTEVDRVVSSDRLTSIDDQFLISGHDPIVSAVPEPQPGILLLAGLAVLGVVSRRRNMPVEHNNSVTISH